MEPGARFDAVVEPYRPAYDIGESINRLNPTLFSDYQIIVLAKP